MTKNLNDFNVIGRLGAEPDMRYTPGGMAITNLNIGCSDDYFDKEANEWVDRTNWFRVTFFKEFAESLASRLGKGDLIRVKAMVKNDSYEKDGVTVNTYGFIGRECEVLIRNKKEERTYNKPAVEEDGDDDDFDNYQPPPF